MGIIVPEALLASSNIAVSNVYMSFSGEAVQTIKHPYTGGYVISSNYRVFSNPTKQPSTNIVEPLMVPYSNLDQGVFTVLYTALKDMYPGSEDSLVNYTPAPVTPDPMVVPEAVSNVISV
jgi:hypothetical protein